MYCRFCGKELPADSNFCPNCGAKQKEEPSSKVSHIDFNSLGIVKYVKSHKAISYTYLVWFLLHLTLYITSSKVDSCDKRFYPFDETFSKVISGGYYDVDYFGNTLNYYDFTEFFGYIFIFPLLIYGIVRLIIYLKYKIRILNVNRKKKVDIQQKEDKPQSSIKNCELDSNRDEKQNHSIILPDAGKIETNDINVFNQIQTESLTNKKEDIETEESCTIDEVKKMPLFRRFFGSLIDKFILIVLFVIGSVAISPYGASGKLGSYYGLRNTPTETYEYIDRIQMNNYGTYSEGVSKYYQDRARLETGTPHIGSTMELDMNITFSFIILNMLYYLLFESTIGGSLGKRMFGGILFDNADDKIGFVKAFVRCLCFGLLMAGTYFFIHLSIGLSNSIVVCVFFLLLDLPLLFTKKSLLDLLTGTKYVKNN